MRTTISRCVRAVAITLIGCSATAVRASSRPRLRYGAMLCVDTSPATGESKRQPVSGVTDKRSDITSGCPSDGQRLLEEKDMTIIEKIEREQMRLDIPLSSPATP